MTPSAAARARGVTEVLHFTTDKGVLGSLRKGALLSRHRVQDDPDLAFIFQAVWPVKAHAWVDFISLSLHTINRDLFRRAERNNPDRWWAVVSFDVSILDHDGVWFATTNNIYPSCIRDQGAAGFNRLYDDPVIGRYQSVHTRAGLPDAQPTDRAAEVLYPGRIELEYLTTLYVPEEQHRQLILAWCDALNRPAVPVSVREDVFE